jgi:hypothetical protein
MLEKKRRKIGLSSGLEYGSHWECIWGNISMKSIMLAVIMMAGMSAYGQEVAFTRVEKDLIPEGIAGDSLTGDGAGNFA